MAILFAVSTFEGILFRTAIDKITTLNKLKVTVGSGLILRKVIPILAVESVMLKLPQSTTVTGKYCEDETSENY